MQTLQPLRPLIGGLKFPEGPRWHGQRLWLSDQHAHRVLAVGLDGRAQTIVELDDMPSGLGFLPDGALLVASMRNRLVLQVSTTGETGVHADLSSLRDGWVNDMVVDAEGRAYVGFIQGQYAGESTGQLDWLVLIEPDGKVRVVADDVARPNGCVISPDGTSMILAESGSNRLSRFTIEKDGSLTSRRLFAALDFRPDGICLDADGAIWVGSPAGRLFFRVREGGEVTDRIETPGKWAIAPALGGPERRTLFLLTAHTSVADLRMLKNAGCDRLSKSKGWVESVQVMVPGAGFP